MQLEPINKQMRHAPSYVVGLSLVAVVALALSFAGISAIDRVEHDLEQRWFGLISGGNPTIQGTFRTTDLVVDNDAHVASALSVGSFSGAVIATAATGTQNNWAPTGIAAATTIVQTSASDLTINGLTTGVDGRKITIYNNGTGAVSIVNGAGASLGANQFATTGTFTTVLYGASFGDTGCSAEFTYLAVDSHWHQTAFNCSTVFFVATSGGAQIAPNGNLTGVQTLIAAAVVGTTVTTGGFGGPTWTKGTGVPSAACNNGDLFSRTDGSTSTTLYVCTATNTWTAK